MKPYQRHLRSSDDLVTTYEAVRAGFIALALEKSRRASPLIAEARALQAAASRAKSPTDLLTISEIKAGLMIAAGLSDKALSHLLPDDKDKAINNLINDVLKPAGDRFVEELVFRFLLFRGDSLGGSMRNVIGAFAQRRLTRAICAALAIADVSYRWRPAKSQEWLNPDPDDDAIELSASGLSWQHQNGRRILLYNLTVPLVRSNVDLCLLSLDSADVKASDLAHPAAYLALGELKGGIDPAGADEHWKTARAALDRIQSAFATTDTRPQLFFVGAAIERRMATEIWQQLESGALSNAANLTSEHQLASLALWLTQL